MSRGAFFEAACRLSPLENDALFRASLLAVWNEIIYYSVYEVAR